MDKFDVIFTLLRASTTHAVVKKVLFLYDFEDLG